MDIPAGDSVIEFSSVAYVPRRDPRHRRVPDGRDTADGQPVLRDLSLQVKRGELLVLLGRSGSGKTTALKLVNGLLLPTGGQIQVEGRSTRDWDLIQLRRHIGYAIQEVGLLPHLTVERNIGLVPRLENWRPEKIRDRVDDLMRLVTLSPEEFRTRYPHELSGGQKQRVGLARALAADPAILLMDEPFGALDPLTRTEVQHEFKSLQQRLKKTVVFVTHDVHEALLLGTRIALLDLGRLLGVYSPAEFLHSSGPQVEAYRAVLRAGEEDLRH